MLRFALISVQPLLTFYYYELLALAPQGELILTCSFTKTLEAFVWHRKIPRDLTEASLSGAGLSILAALAMVFLFGMVSPGDCVSAVCSCNNVVTIVVWRWQEDTLRGCHHVVGSLLWSKKTMVERFYM